MVAVKYKGQNYLLFGSTKIVNGFNDIADQEFYKLMKYPTFSNRISSGILSVPNGFPLEDPKLAEKNKQVKENPKEETEKEEETESGLLSVKQTLKNIQKSDDLDFLKGVLKTDEREKVKEAATKRLDALDSKEEK